jgi:FtsZ-binding cell division protein ZapB
MEEPSAHLLRKHGAFYVDILGATYFLQEKQALVLENRRVLEAAQQEAATFQERISQAHTTNELAQMDLKAAVNENEHLARDLQRAQAAVDALEHEHKRFVEHATQLCKQKDGDLAV